MSSELQIAANRLNAQKSTGPKTPEGRAAVRLNGVKHGITAQTLVLKGESGADFTTLLDSYEVEHEPATPTEEALVQQLAMATWRLRRLYNAEAGFYTRKLNDVAEDAAKMKLDAAGSLGLVVTRNADTLQTFNRQESRLERTFYRALHELQRLRSQRQPKLALVSQTVPTPPPQATDNRTSESAHAEVAENAPPDPAPTLHLVPPPADMP